MPKQSKRIIATATAIATQANVVTAASEQISRSALTLGTTLDSGARIDLLRLMERNAEAATQALAILQREIGACQPFADAELDD